MYMKIGSGKRHKMDIRTSSDLPLIQFLRYRSHDILLFPIPISVIVSMMPLRLSCTVRMYICKIIHLSLIINLQLRVSCERISTRSLIKHVYSTNTCEQLSAISPLSGIIRMIITGI